MNRNIPWVEDKLKKWKTAAARIIASDDMEPGEAPADASSDAPIVELEPRVFEQCQRWADFQQIRVQDAVNFIVSQYFVSLETEERRYATMEHKENNPLLKLDALLRAERHEMEGTQHDYSADT